MDVPPKTNGSGPQNVRNGERRRAELADFLRRRRESIKPEDVGLRGGGRRRTPGLRREEVAQLAGVGATWFTWLEQGRDVRASLEVLEALAGALRLTPAERTHLILLGRGEEAPVCKPPAERASPSIRRLVQSLGPNPAYVIGRRWDYLAWNEAACALFGEFAAIPKPARNHLWQIFMDRSRRETLVDWEPSARLAVAKFRADTARHLGDSSFEELINALRQSSLDFCKGGNDTRWPARGTVARSSGSQSSASCCSSTRCSTRPTLPTSASSSTPRCPQPTPPRSSRG